MREALASSQLDYLYCPLLLVPFGAPLVLHTHTALSAFAGATLLRSRSVVEAQNVILIASLALNGSATYLLALQASTSRSAALAAGALFVGAPAGLIAYADYYYAVFFALFAVLYLATELWTGHMHVSRRQNRTPSTTLFVLPRLHSWSR